MQASYQDPNGGVLLTSVAAGGPADVAGIKSGDVILTIDGSLLTMAGDLTALVRAYAPGSGRSGRLPRNGATHTAQVKLVVDTG